MMNSGSRTVVLLLLIVDLFFNTNVVITLFSVKSFSTWNVIDNYFPNKLSKLEFMCVISLASRLCQIVGIS